MIRLLMLIGIVMGYGASSWGADPMVRSKDRIVLLGGTITEQMQRFGYFEAMLQLREPDLQLSVRNLGWSGDDASAMARKVFGDPNQGFARLLKDLETAEPTVVLVAYGTAEALDGMAAARGFEAKLQRVLDEIDRRQARVILVKPYLMTGAKRSDYQEAYNSVRETLDRVAAARKYSIIDPAPALSATDLPDGLHPQADGHWKYADALVQQLTGKPATIVSPMQFSAKPDDKGGSIRQTVRLPGPLQPGQKNFVVRFKATGLQPREYTVHCGSWSKAFAAKDLEAGIDVPVQALSDLSDQLVTTVRDKDELFFHRHRPQNETYLFLFRKHEQGNNAVEIPQFDPLLQKSDQQIRSLAGKALEVDIRCE